MRKLTLGILLLLVPVACNGTVEDDATLDLEDDNQRASYAQGYQIGQQGQGLPLEIDAFLAGIRDGLEDSGQLDDAQLESALGDFNRIISEAQAEAHAAIAGENAAEGEAFLAENAARPEVEVTASGLQYEVLEEGDGPRPTAEDTVVVHYRGTLIDGTEFESSYEGGEPARFPLARVIPGWTEGVQLMPVGSKYKFWVPGELAYGEAGRPETGPNRMLIFEVELLEIADEPEGAQPQ